jgi:stage II sporulation protein D
LSAYYRITKRKGPPPALLALLALTLAGVILYQPTKKQAAQTPPQTQLVATLIPSQAAENMPKTVDIQIYDAQQNKLLTMNLEEFVAHVVAAEMPASYDPEALKAQAVAARTLAAYKMDHGGCSKAEGAVACTDHGHCQAYASDEDMKKKWGDQFDQYRDKIVDAVTQTAGQVICYAGEPIEIFYHAQSAGATEQSENVFSRAEPYLVSVSSGEKVEPVQVRLTAQEAAEKINAAYPDAKVDPDKLSSQLKVEKSNASGRVAQMQAGRVTLTGVQARWALGLRSAQFTIEFADGEVVFTTWGYGHGVGMSQAGAQAMADTGGDYIDILSHYYPGTSLEDYFK